MQLIRVVAASLCINNFSLNREKLAASIIVSRINTEIDLVNIQRLPYFRIIIAIDTATDMVYNTALKDYIPIVESLHGTSAATNSEWYSANSVIEEQVLNVQMTESQVAMLTNDVSVMLSVAVEFGMVGFTGTPIEVKYAGSGKVLKVY